MPRDVPQANFIECKASGANVTLVDGLISDCGRIVNERKQAEGWFDVSTFKEPYRIEGKKTMGYEVAEQLDWQLPDAIFYPAGGGVGLIGMWKAFAEMEALGWIGPKRPKMIAVQAEGCQPVVKAFESGADTVEMYANASTVAAGFRVPKPLGRPAHAPGYPGEWRMRNRDQRRRDARRRERNWRPTKGCSQRRKAGRVSAAARR